MPASRCSRPRNRPPTGTQRRRPRPAGDATGPASFRVVGLTPNVQENGTVRLRPARDAEAGARTGDRQRVLGGRPLEDHAAIDRARPQIEDLLSANGYEIGTEITYVGERDNVAGNRQMSTTITVLGLLIVAIGMVGLVSAITMSVLERTREIGILRCVGARARDVRRVFATEGPRARARGLAARHPVRLRDRPPVRLAGRRRSSASTCGSRSRRSTCCSRWPGRSCSRWLLMRFPLRRAVRFRPGEALRHA